jgi:hypothetical protein
MMSSFATVINTLTATSFSVSIIMASILSVNGTTVIRTSNPHRNAYLRPCFAARTRVCGAIFKSRRLTPFHENVRNS